MEPRFVFQNTVPPAYQEPEYQPDLTKLPELILTFLSQFGSQSFESIYKELEEYEGFHITAALAILKRRQLIESIPWLNGCLWTLKRH